MEQETLAHKLGTATHLSPLLMKARRLGLHGPEALEALAVQRGCRHYWHDQQAVIPEISEEAFSNEELSLALLTIAQFYDPHTIRCEAAMLGNQGNDVPTLVRLATWERSQAVVSYVAACDKKFEPDNPFGEQLLAALPEPPSHLKGGVMPHPTRFVAMTGFTRRGKETIMQWIRPSREDAA